MSGDVVAETFPGETFERLLASAIAADWRTHWRTAIKRPANRNIRSGLETVIRR
jgi:hypothetical protein